VVDSGYGRWQGSKQVTPHDSSSASPWSSQFTGHPALYGRFSRGRSATLAPPESTLLLNPYTRFETPARAGVLPHGAEALRTASKGGRDLDASPDGNIYQRRENGWYRRQAGNSWSLAASTPGKVEMVNLPAGQLRSVSSDGKNRMAAVHTIRTEGGVNRVPDAGSGRNPEMMAAMEREYYARALSQMRQQGGIQAYSRRTTTRPGGRRR